MPESDVDRIRKRLGHAPLEREVAGYLDTGSEHLNAVLGNAEKGVAWGTIIELSGMESQGKTLLAMKLLAASQQAGASGIWFDCENSFDPVWAKTQGIEVEIGDDGKVIHTDKFALIQPYVGYFGKEREPRMITAQEQCAEVEAIVKRRSRRNPNAKFLIVVDSVTGLSTEDEANAGVQGQNMRTKLSLASFLSQLLRRWVGFAPCYNTTIVLVNQVRISPMQMFGNPEYTPGGKALKFYSHVRARMRRAKGGKMTKSGKVIGVKGVLTNIKNKAGGVEGSKCAYKLFFNGKARMLPADSLTKED